MSRFKKLTHVIWHCQYHIVWVPKYRYRVLKGAIGREVRNCVEVYCSRLRCEVEELNVQVDHVHMLVSVPPKVSISQLMGVGSGERKERVAGVYAISAVTETTLLGQSLLGQGLLCGYGRAGCGDDTSVCQVSGEGGTQARGFEFTLVFNRARIQLACLL